MDELFIDCTLVGTGIISAILPEVFAAMEDQGKGQILSWLKTEDDLFFYWEVEKEFEAVPLIEPMGLTETIRVARNWVSKKTLEKKGWMVLQADNRQIHISILPERTDSSS